MTDRAKDSSGPPGTGTPGTGTPGTGTPGTGTPGTGPPGTGTPGTGTPISSIPNLGPASEAAFARAGITSAEQLRALGADEAYLRLLKSGNAPHFIGYYVIVMGLQGRPWNDCKGAEKAALRQKFDALKARVPRKGRSELDAALDFFGVIEKPGQ